MAGRLHSALRMVTLWVLWLAQADTEESIHGTVSARMRARWVEDADDQDFTELVTARWRDPERHAISLSLSARFNSDLDGDRKTLGYSAFDSLDDAREHATTARVYTAYLTWNPGADLQIRAGRQQIDETPEYLHIDGVRVRYRPHESVTVGAFGGLPVNLFESSPSGDLTAGGWVEWRPWSRTRIALDYAHLSDETRFGEFDDDLVGLTLEQGVGAFVVCGRVTALEWEGRDLDLRASGTLAEFILDARIRVVFRRQVEHALAIDPYATFLFDQEPYVQGSLRASRMFGENFAVDASVQARELRGDDDDTPFNHSFWRFSVSPRTLDWPVRGMSLSVSFDYWNSREDDFWTVGGGAHWRISERWEAGAGTAFQLWTIDTFAGVEREKVRTIYGTVRFRIADGWWLNARVSVEKDGDDTWTVLEAGAQLAF